MRFIRHIIARPFLLVSTIVVILLACLNFRIMLEYHDCKTPSFSTGYIKKQSLSGKDIANNIIQKSFYHTYQHLLKYSNNMSTQMIFEDLLSNDTLTMPTQSPWWFKTILRDGKNHLSGLNRGWHKKELNDENCYGGCKVGLKKNTIKMCAIEKVAISEWSSVFKKTAEKSNDQEVYNNNTTTKSNESDDFRFVFFRDPLSRFLSAFLNKCTGYFIGEKHCEPNEIYGPDKRTKDKVKGADSYIGNSSQEHRMNLHIIDHNDQTLFEAYVDTMPLKWNLHFFPQSFYCDGIYRHLNEYDFIGNMDKRYFADDIVEVSNTVGGVFEHQVYETFKVNEILNKTKEKKGNLGSSKGFGGGAHASGANSLVEQYYTPYTLRRVLEYTSIDYIMLGLSIPEWAERMLEDDLSG